jgi:hypothetical protein
MGFMVPQDLLFRSTNTPSRKSFRQIDPPLFFFYMTHLKRGFHDNSTLIHTHIAKGPSYRVCFLALSLPSAFHNIDVCSLDTRN